MFHTTSLLGHFSFHRHEGLGSLWHGVLHYNELIHHHSVLYICEIDIKSFKYWICLFPLTKENVPLTGTGIVGHCTASVRTIRETWALSQSPTIQCSVFTIHTAHTLTRSLSHCYCPGVVQNLHETKYFTHLYLWQYIVQLLRFETHSCCMWNEHGAKSTSFVSHPYYQYEYYYSLLSGPSVHWPETHYYGHHAPEHRITISNKSSEVITCGGMWWGDRWQWRNRTWNLLL